MKKIRRIITKAWTLMEIFGARTHSLVKNGIPDMLPRKINMKHGQGCPIFVPSLSETDEAIHLAKQPRRLLYSFGEVLQVWDKHKVL